MFHFVLFKYGIKQRLDSIKLVPATMEGYKLPMNILMDTKTFKYLEIFRQLERIRQLPRNILQLSALLRERTHALQRSRYSRIEYRVAFI